MLKLSVLFFAVLSSCSSAKKTVTPATGGMAQIKVVTPTAAPIEIAKAAGSTTAWVARPITQIGDNRSPRFSPDGSHLLFLSSARPSHKQAQVYILDLLRMTERRVTFHDGDDEGASWDGQTKIVYSSTTDEIKENVSLDRIKADYEASKAASAPNGVRPLPRVVNGGDIYLQRLDGREIERITDVTGPDTSPTASGDRIVFVSSRAGDPQLFLYNGSATRSVSHGPDAAPAFSYDGHSLAFERSLVKDQSQIFVTDDLREAQPLTAPGFRDRDPAWSGKGDSVVFASNRGGHVFDLYLIDRKASCLKRLTQVQADAVQPAMSPDGSKIAFVTKTGPQNQIYLMDDRSASLPCLPSKP